ncbi:MAG TPA: stealth conserved region 3 domain-containing protein [Vicinamibacterales bacterium]|nr:stealth conserved region 3 domain-containing protein [Vicinamibacterales bacterium]
MPSPPADDPIDIVYTWVDDAWPGYLDMLRQHASTRHDLNPNRTRDNLQVLKYSLRSLARFLPWARRVYLVTCRPQVPWWLKASAVTLVHHDEFIPREHLPTFNSFAIVAHLHRLPGIARRFVYVEDDRLFGRPVQRSDFFAADGRIRIYEALRGTPRGGRRNASGVSPWNLALARSNALLDVRFGSTRRGQLKFAPLAVDCESWIDMERTWPEAFAHTVASRFRAAGDVAPEHLYPYFLLATGRAVRVPRSTIARHAWYQPLNNVVALQWIGMARLRWFAPAFACLNDNFGAKPSPGAIAVVTRALDRWFPAPSPFEVPDGSFV